MKILITGTDGFIGSNLKNFFMNQGHDVTGTVFMREPEEDEFSVNFTDIESFKALPDVYYDAVIHTVGIVDQRAKSSLMYDVNVNGTKNLCAWIQEKKCIEHFVQMSSVTVYGLSMLGQNITEDQPRYEGSFAIPYMRTKAMAEKVIEESKIPYSILRLPAVFGQGDTYVSPVIAEFMMNKNFHFYGEGNKLISLMYVKNLGSLIEIIIKKGPLMDCYNATDYSIPWKTFAHEYSHLLGCPIPRKQKGYLSLLLHPFDKKRQLIMMYSLFGTHNPDDQLRKITGWQPPYSWKLGVEDAVAEILNKTI